MPTEFAFTLSNRYGEADDFPTDPAVFENLLVNMKKAGFNTIYCVYRDWRVEQCRKHGIKMMVDVLAWKPGAETDIRRNEQQRARVKQICEKCRGDNAIWGYNIWNEKLAWFGYPDGKSIDDYIRMLKKWDPTHPVWMGAYQNAYANAPKSKPGVHAYYDYAWQRHFVWHFADLNWYYHYVSSQHGVMGKWMEGSNYNQNSHELNTSIAFGLKAMIWFIGGPFDAKTGNIDPKHRFYHLVKIGQEMQLLYPEIAKIGRPYEVLSTPTTKWHDGKSKEKDIPFKLKPFPADFWFQVRGGEAVIGFFKYPDGSDAVYIANHNAFGPQEMAFTVAAPAAKGLKVELFDREKGGWKELTARDGPMASRSAPPAATSCGSPGAGPNDRSRVGDSDRKMDDRKMKVISFPHLPVIIFLSFPFVCFVCFVVDLWQLLDATICCRNGTS